jgi:hypothetical protein
MDTIANDEDLVMVPVPRRVLGAVYATIAAGLNAEKASPDAEKGSPAPPPSGSTAGEEVMVTGQGPWTAEMVARLERDLRHPALRNMMTLVADRAPKWVTFEEAIQASGGTRYQLRAQLGTLTKAGQKLFGRPTWPMEWRAGEGELVEYSMEGQVAEWWHKSVAEGGGAV